MLKKYKKFEIAGFFITSALAVLFHFLYELLPSAVIAAIAPVNESVWEHIKIIFFPYLIYAIIELIIFKEDKQRIIRAKCYALAFLPLMLLTFHYTYTGFLGYRVEYIDIASTFLFLLEGFIISYFAYKKECTKLSNTAKLLTIAFAVMLITFTFFPPRLEAFKDLTSQAYGILKPYK